MHCIMLFVVSQTLLVVLSRSFYIVCCFLFLSILVINLFTYLLQAAYRRQCENAYTCVMCCRCRGFAAGMEQALPGDVRLRWT